MKTNSIMNWSLGGVLSLGLLFIQTTFGQNGPQFTAINTSPEKTIQLQWSSVSNEVYELDEADALAGNADGSTTWNKLYDNYPSQGTNTLIGDFGNYLINPSILNPNQMPMRFYRLVDKGASAGGSPIVAINSITNDATLTGQITIFVTVTSSLPFVTTALYVDGQQMDASNDGTNYVINTCEWLNGSHFIYATANAQSTLSGPSGSFPITIGRGVSPFINVTFNNLITEVAFSQPFFQPNLGQTQEVTASFAANVNWTLQMIDEYSNAVRTVAGSGISLLYDWDGTGDGETNIPDGVYYYSITAQTNGKLFLPTVSMASSRLSSTASLSSSSEDELEQVWAVAPDSSVPIPLEILPPGIGTNGYTFFEASQSEIRALAAAASPASSAVRIGTFTPSASITSNGGASPNAASSLPSQNTIAPTRPPTSPVKGSMGDVGVAYFDHSATNVYRVPRNGLPLPGNSGNVKIEAGYGNIEFDPIPQAAGCANNFISRMKKKGWWGPNSFNLSGSSIHINDLRRASLGGNEIFGNVNIGLFIDHGSYGSSLDYNSDANQSLTTYLASDNPSDASAPWLRLSEFGLGGNLRWMAILACNTLRDQNYNSMLNQGALPIKGNLHLLCGCSTITAVGQEIGKFWAENMTKSFFSGGPETVQQAWYDAGRQQYSNATSLTEISAIVFRVAGQDNCMEDTLTSYPTTTSGDITEQHKQVWP